MEQWAPGQTLAGVLLVCVQVVVTVALTWLSIRLAIRSVMPRLAMATAPTNLRTE